MIILICFGFGFLLALEIGLFEYLCSQNKKNLEELASELKHLMSRFESMRDYVNDNCVCKDEVDLITEHLNLEYKYVPGEYKLVKKGK